MPQMGKMSFRGPNIKPFKMPGMPGMPKIPSVSGWFSSSPRSSRSSPESIDTSRPPQLSMPSPRGRFRVPSWRPGSPTSWRPGMPTRSGVASAMNTATQPFRKIGRSVGSIGSSFKGPTISGIKLPDTSWSTTKEKYGETLDPAAEARSTAYEGSYFATALVATQAFVSRNYGHIMLIIILCIAASLLCTGIYMYYKRTREVKRDVQEREWGVCRTVDEVLRRQKQENAKTTRPPMKYYPVVSQQLRTVKVYD